MQNYNQNTYGPVWAVLFNILFTLEFFLGKILIITHSS